MFKYLIPLILLATPIAAQDKPMFNAPFMASQPCTEFPVVANLIREKGEEMLFKGNIVQRHVSGQIVPAQMVFMTNQDTGSWTLLALYPGNIACLVANGEEFEPWASIN